jgi:hypothetical protein
LAVPAAKAERNPDWVADMTPVARAAMLKFAAGLRKRLTYNELKY